MKKILVLSLLVLVFVGAHPVAAHPAGTFAEKNPREAIEAYRIWKLTEALDLSEDQMPLFFSRLREIDEREAALRREELDALKDIKQLLGRDQVDDGQLKKALARYTEARKKRIEEVRKMRGELMEMLTPRQQCQYVLFEEHFRKNLREIVERARATRRSGGSPGPGGEDLDFGRPPMGDRGRGRSVR